MDLHVTKKQTNVLKRGNNCEDYGSHKDFTRCAKDVIEKEVLKKATCVSHMSKPIIPNADLPECATVEESLQNDLHVQDGIVGFVVNTSKAGCPLPCQYIQYKIRANYFDEIESNQVPGGLKMYTYFDSMVVESQSEILIYDWPKFLSAIGGTLGLYLGFSCLSSLFFMAKTVAAFKDYKKGTTVVDVKQ